MEGIKGRTYVTPTPGKNRTMEAELTLFALSNSPALTSKVSWWMLLTSLDLGLRAEAMIRHPCQNHHGSITKLLIATLGGLNS
ncbi:MAG: hypothetical protein ABI120_08290 [Gemmatimonadaceae bacterium]